MERNRLDTADPLIDGSIKPVLDTLDKEHGFLIKILMETVVQSVSLKFRHDTPNG